MFSTYVLDLTSNRTIEHRSVVTGHLIGADYPEEHRSARTVDIRTIPGVRDGGGDHGDAVLAKARRAIP
jgi:hypothetical protein